MPKVNILYHHFPHYRRPVMRALQSSSKHSYRFFGGHNDVAGIKAIAGSDDIKVEEKWLQNRAKTFSKSSREYQ